MTTGFLDNRFPWNYHHYTYNLHMLRTSIDSEVVLYQTNDILQIVSCTPEDMKKKLDNGMHNSVIIRCLTICTYIEHQLAQQIITRCWFTF